MRAPGRLGEGDFSVGMFLGPQNLEVLGDSLLDPDHVRNALPGEEELLPWGTAAEPVGVTEAGDLTGGASASDGGEEADMLANETEALVVVVR